MAPIQFSEQKTPKEAWLLPSCDDTVTMPGYTRKDSQVVVEDACQDIIGHSYGLHTGMTHFLLEMLDSHHPPS